jgi:DNA-binding NtrC family response regulator
VQAKSWSRANDPIEKRKSLMAVDILIVDDEKDIRELVAGVLSDEGYECRTAGDSRAALDEVDRRRPSLVLLDVWLHGSPMDGLEVLDAIKTREPDLPVIIFPAMATSIRRWPRSGAGRWISSKSRLRPNACCIW